MISRPPTSSGRSPKKISTSATQNTLNRHLSYRDHSKPDPADARAEIRVCLPERLPCTSADLARRPHRATYPFPESRGGFRRRSDEEPARPATPKTQPWPTLAATASPFNLWVPPCNRSYRWAPSAAKASPARTVPTLFGCQPMQTSTNPHDLPRIPRISRTISVGRKLRGVSGIRARPD